MSIIRDSLKNLSDFMQNHQVSFSNGLLILFTIGGEQIFKMNAFNCPKTQPQARDYALTYIIAPALILLIICMAVSNLTWRVSQGCCKREKGYNNGYRNSFVYYIMIFARSAIVPGAWLFITFLDGGYYACMRANAPGDKTTDEYSRLVAQSQVISWVSLSIVIFVTFIIICVVRCCCESWTYMQNRYVSSYREAEQRQLENEIEAFTKELAEKNVKEFMTNKKLEKKDWDDISRVPNIVNPPEIAEVQSELKENGKGDHQKLQDPPIISDRPQEQPQDSPDHPQPTVVIPEEIRPKFYLTYLNQWVESNKVGEQKKIASSTGAVPEGCEGGDRATIDT